MKFETYVESIVGKKLLENEQWELCNMIFKHLLKDDNVGVKALMVPSVIEVFLREEFELQYTVNDYKDYIVISNV